MGKFKEYDVIQQELEQRRITSPDGQSGITIPDYYQLLEVLKLLKESNNEEATSGNIERPESSRYSDKPTLSVSDFGS